MELSTTLQGFHATASPSGQYLALITNNSKLRICAAYAPERCTEIAIRIQAKDVASLRWNNIGNRVAILSPRNIEVVDLDDASHRVRLSNGSGGLGRFVAVDFVGDEQLLVVWEFGKAKLWDLGTGKGVEVSDVKTVYAGEKWQVRPGTDAARRTLAVLSRPGADDMLNIYLPNVPKQLAAVKLPTLDAQSVSWSPDGRWLAVLDTPTASPSVHFFTPDGHLFRSYASTHESPTSGLGVKSLTWQPHGQTIALTRHDSRIVLLNTRTFTPSAIIEHTTTISQPENAAPIWQETVSASNDRSYTSLAQPVSPPLSRTKPAVEPGELGVAEARFSCGGNFLATRDERMLNTVWVWDMATLGAHAVLIQHSNVRRLCWHPSREGHLMIDCGEGIAYLCDAASPSNPPVAFRTNLSVGPTFSWLCTPAESLPAILAATKSSSRLIYPEGAPSSDDMVADQPRSPDAVEGDEDLEDSLFDVLSGRKPMHAKTEESYTERVDLEVQTEDEDYTTRMDDTFVEKKRETSKRPVPTDVDPFDDSEIF